MKVAQPELDHLGRILAHARRAAGLTSDEQFHRRPPVVRTGQGEFVQDYTPTLQASPVKDGAREPT